MASLSIKATKVVVSIIVFGLINACSTASKPWSEGSVHDTSRVVATLELADGTSSRRVLPFTHDAYEIFYGLEDTNVYSVTVQPSGDLKILEALVEDNKAYFDAIANRVTSNWAVDLATSSAAVMTVSFLQFADTETALLISEARAMEQDGDNQQALVLLDQVANDDRDSVAVLVAQGEVYSNLLQLQKAITYYNRAIEKAPKNERLLYARAHRLYQAKHYQQAIRDLMASIESAPIHWEAYNLLVDIYSELNDVKQALKYAALGAPLRDDGYFEDKQGWIFLSIDSYDSAKRLFNRALAVNKENGSSLSGLARVLYQEQDYHDALSTVNQAIDVDGDNTYDLNLKGLIYDELGELNMAISTYNKVIERFEPNSMTYNNLGWIYLKQKNYKNAINVFKEQVEKGLGSLKQQYNLATAYFYVGEYQKSLSEFMQALKKDGEQNAFAHAWIARNLIRLRRADEALVHLQIVAQTDIDYPDSLYIEHANKTNGFADVVSELVLFYKQTDQLLQQKQAEALLVRQ